MDYDDSSTSVSLCFYDSSIRTNGKGGSIQEKVEISQVFSETGAKAKDLIASVSFSAQPGMANLGSTYL